jgi:hypothetical protein
VGTSIEYSRHHGLYYGDMPGRKSKCLCVQEGGAIHTVAYFRNLEEYRRFKAAMLKVLGAYGPYEGNDEQTPTASST